MPSNHEMSSLSISGRVRLKLALAMSQGASCLSGLLLQTGTNTEDYMTDSMIQMTIAGIVFVAT